MNASIEPQTNFPRVKRSALDNTISTIIPTSFDFRTHGKVTPIKDQGQCGSCWAHSTTAAIESQYLLRYNQSLDLSEQMLVNCETTYSGGCDGGQPQGALHFAKFNGLSLESCYPYVGNTGEDLFHPELTHDLQPCTDCALPKYKIDGYQSYGTTETEIASNLYNFGPASMTFFVPWAFMSYKSGILNIPATECNYNNNVGAHAVTLIGYTPDYWIAKNSWGTNWGEAGYFRFKRGTNFCLMTTDVVAPFLNSPTPTTTTTTTTKAPITTTSATTTTSTKPSSTTKITTTITTLKPTTPTTTTTTKAPTTSTTATPSTKPPTTTTKPSTSIPITTTTTTTTKPSTPPTTTKPPLTCAGAIDLVFIIDNSDTMTSARFNIVKSQLATAITQSNIVWGNNNAHVGIVLSTGLNPGWRTTPYRYIDLNGCQFTSDECTSTITSTATLITAIQNLKFFGGKNDISLSMSETMTGEFEGLLMS
uniref:VWFA domain-containing protein n=1 Tax=Panagrolaimus superbus TaxID=310955 RepID=A0A914YL69_9BILA